MQEPPTPGTPVKKRTAIKRTQPKLWQEQSLGLSVPQGQAEKLQQAVDLLEKRVHYLEQEVQELLELLSEQEDSTDYTQEEEEMN